VQSDEYLNGLKFVDHLVLFTQMRGATMINRIKKNFIGNSPNLLLVAFLVIVACSPVGHIPELNPEQLAKRVNQPPPTELTYKLVPYDTITVRFTYHPEYDPKEPVAFARTGKLLWTE
jgi:hypothetical protein